MAGVASAGTLVAAVLETAGYVTQEYILLAFENFFRAAGVLIYLIACIGALMSFVLFGSYRNGFYLLLGPILFFFLIGTYDVTPGVAWKLGGGSLRTPAGTTQSEEQATAAVRQIVAAKQKDKNALKDKIRLAWPFMQFTKVIDRLINTFVDIVLHYENDEDLLFVAKTRAMEELMSANVDDSKLLQMFRGDLFLECNAMIDAALMLGSRELSKREELYLLGRSDISTTAAYRDAYYQAAEDIDSRRDEHRRRFENSKLNGRVNPSRAMREFMISTQDTPKSAAGEWRASAGVAQIDNETPMTLSCGEAWKVMEDAIYRQAEMFSDSLGRTFGSELSDADKTDLCRLLARKIGRSTSVIDNASACSIVDVTAIYLIRNAISKTSYSSTIQQLKNEMQFLGGVRSGTVAPFEQNGSDLELVGGPYDYKMGVDEYEGRKRLVAEFQRKSTGETEWHPYIMLGQIQSQLGASFTEHQRYQTRGLRESIFSYALQMPYWQGLILFVLAAAYPFMALIVVLPGRAASFLIYPLAWIWVKSWDVGFAFVMVLDKILWNMLPSTDFDADFYGGRKLGDQALPSLFSEAFKIDPTFNVHIYYLFLSLALFSIPMITGYLTVKAKRGLFATFTGGVDRVSGETGQRAEAAYEMGVMNEKNQYLKELAGAAMFSKTPYATGLGGEGRASSGAAWALMGTAAEVVAGSAGGLRAAAQKSLTAPATYLNQFAAMTGREAGTDAAIAAADHPLLGRWGPLAQASDAGAQAVDGSGGFEMNELSYMNAAMGAHLGRFSAKVGTATEAVGTLVGGAGGLGRKLPVLGQIAGWSSSLVGIDAVRRAANGEPGSGLGDLFGAMIQEEESDERAKRLAQKVGDLGYSAEELEKIFHYLPGVTEKELEKGPIPPVEAFGSLVPPTIKRSGEP